METNMDNCQVVNHPFRCAKCTESFKSVTDLSQHFESVHDFPFKCMLCSERFSQISLAEEHFMKVHEGNEDHSSNEDNKENKLDSLDISIEKVKETQKIQKNHESLENNHVISVVKHKDIMLLKPERNHLNTFVKPHEKEAAAIEKYNSNDISIVKIKETQTNREYIAKIKEKSCEKEAAKGQLISKGLFGVSTQ